MRGESIGRESGGSVSFPDDSGVTVARACLTPTSPVVKENV